jgi:hypothetical protein
MDKKRVLIVNHSVQNCGVYQYGKRFSDIATKSEDYEVFYVEIESIDEYEQKLEEIKPNIILYNHLTGTMPWFNESVCDRIRQRGIRQGTIVHNVAYSSFFDFYVHQHPFWNESKSNYSMVRPLFSKQFEEFVFDENEEELRIGTFGFGFRVKHYDSICRMVNQQLGNIGKKIKLKLHLTLSHFCDNKEALKDIVNRCNSEINSPNVSLEITTNFLTNEEMLEFLSKNHLNVFLYEYYSSYNGISSVIDYALTVRRPIAVCKSNMFSHINDCSPSICVEENSLYNIIKNGFVPLQSKYDAWTNENFIKKFNKIILDELKF